LHAAFDAGEAVSVAIWIPIVLTAGLLVTATLQALAAIRQARSAAKQAESAAKQAESAERLTTLTADYVRLTSELVDRQTEMADREETESIKQQRVAAAELKRCVDDLIEMATRRGAPRSRDAIRVWKACADLIETRAPLFGRPISELGILVVAEMKPVIAATTDNPSNTVIDRLEELSGALGALNPRVGRFAGTLPSLKIESTGTVSDPPP
jgi:multidrug efflux pump subunit AcrA (membrane-fusion protein)